MKFNFNINTEEFSTKVAELQVLLGQLKTSRWRTAVGDGQCTIPCDEDCEADCHAMHINEASRDILHPRHLHLPRNWDLPADYHDYFPFTVNVC